MIAAVLLAAPAIGLSARAARSSGGTGGSASGFRLRIAPTQRRLRPGQATSFRVTLPAGRVRLSIGGLPRATHARWQRGRSGLILSLTTTGRTPPGRYHVVVGVRRGSRRAYAAIQLVVIRPAAGHGTGSGSATTGPFTVSGNVRDPLEPGLERPLDLRLTNPFAVPLRVSSLSVMIQRVQAPGASAALPCDGSDFAVVPYSGSLPLSVPGRSSRDLAGLGVPSTEWPQVLLRDLPVDQDGCRGATVTLGYRGGGTLG